MQLSTTAYKYVAGFLILAASGLVLPALRGRSASLLSAADIACAKTEARQLLTNPIEKGLVRSLAVSKRTGRGLQVTAYTLFALPYAQLQVACGGPSLVLWRAISLP